MSETPTPRIDNAFRNPLRKGPSMNATLDSVYLEGRKLEQELTAERALADRLGTELEIALSRPCPRSGESIKALTAWKEARK